MAEKDWIALVKEFVIEQSSGIKNSIFYAEDVGGVKYEFVLEFPDNIPTKTGISGSEIIDVNKTLDDTIVNVQRVFPDGEVIVDYSFNAKGKGGDVQALDNFNKILKEGKGMKGVLLEYYDTFPVETTIPTTLENDITIPNTLESIDTPTNVVDEGIELYHSISKGQTVNKNLHAGTYNAALDRASQFYGGEQLYKIANDNLNFIQEQANDLVSELSEQVSFEKVEDFYEVTDGMVTREITITLPTGVEADFNIVAETSNNDLTVKFQDLDGYDGAEIYSETLWDIENEPNSLKSSTSTINIIDDENVAEGLLDEIGLKSQAGDFNLRNGYDLYKVNINPSANVVNIPNTAIFVENGIKKEMSSDFIQGFIERPETVNQYKNVEQIIIDGKSYDITDNFTSAQALQEHFKDADVLVYINDIEDVGSKSYIFMNENSYVLEKINDAQFNTDVANKYIKNNPYETISKLAREEAFTEPERYQVLLDALLNETDTPTSVVSNIVDYDLVDNQLGESLPVIKNPDNFPLPANTIFGRPLSQDEYMRILIERDRDVYLKVFEDAASVTGIKLPDYKPSTIMKIFGFNEYNFNKYASTYYDDYLIKTYWQNKQKDIVDIVQKIKSGQINNIDSKKLTQFIYELQAFETSGRFQDVDEKADIVKKVIFGNEKILETGVDFGSDFGKYVEAVGVNKEVVTILQNNSENIKTILKDTINKELKNIYPNEYIVVFRSPNLNNLDDVDNPLSSYSKDLSVSQEMSRYQTPDGNVPYLPTEEGKAGVKAYLVPTNEIIDTEALGIRGGIKQNEKEILINPNKVTELDVSVIEDMKSNKEIKINELLSDTPTNVVDDVVMNKSEAIDNIDNLIDELPLEETFKNQVKKNTARISKNVATPGGIIDLIDAWELGVLALGVTAIATGEIDEIPTIMYNQGVKMYNNMLSSVGLPVQVEEKPYNINFEKAINTFNIAEMFMPTAYVEKAAVKEFKKGQEAGIDISVGLGAGVGVPPMQFKTEQPKEDTGNINSIMTNLMSNISNAQKSYPITADEIGTFGRNPINVVPEDTKDKPVKVEYDSKEKQNLHDIYANLYTKLSNASARVE